MKFKKICTLAIIAIISLTGCSINTNNESTENTSYTNNESTENTSYTNNEPLENLNYTNNEEYFEMYENRVNLDEIKGKDDPNVQQDTFYIYEPDIENGTDEILKAGKTLISSELTREEQLIILCDYLEDKLDNIDISVHSNINNKFAVVIAIEKYGIRGSNQDLRGGMIYNTLNQADFNKEWFEHVEVIYDTGLKGDR